LRTLIAGTLVAVVTLRVGRGLLGGQAESSAPAGTRVAPAGARAACARAGLDRGHRAWVRRILFATLLGVAATSGVGIAIAFRRHALSAHQSAAAGTLTVAGSSHARPLPNGFLGLSFEFRGLEEYLGKNPAAIDQPFLQLVRNLAPGQRPVLRIGGDSTDWTWWPLPGTPRPGGVKYNLNPGWTRMARALSGALGARLILGVNFEADRRAIARAEAASMVDGIGTRSIAALELGNEPELYTHFDWYRTAGGQGVKGRAAGYNFGTYLHDYASVSGSLPGVTLAGPSSGSARYLDYLGQFLGQERRVGLVTIHAYPLKRCVPSDRPSNAQLLAPATLKSLTSQVAAYVAVAHAHGRPLRVDEMNSVSCGGYAPVTLTFGPALWALEQLFELDAANVDGVNFDTIPNTLQHLIGVSRVHGHWATTVQPEYYGLLAFAQAAPLGARLAATTGSLPPTVNAFATLASGHSTHVVLINTGPGPASIRLNLAGQSGPVKVWKLSAPGLGATGRVTLGGQSIDPWNGQLTGTQNVTYLAPSAGADPGAYQVVVAPNSATIVSTS
jgi:hypothetical protein